MPKTKKTDSAFMPETQIVVLHGKKYPVDPVPLRRLMAFTDLVNAVMDEIAPPPDEARTMTNQDFINNLFAIIRDKPGELLQILIPDLDLEAFNDEETGATVPEIMYAFEVCAAINHLEWLKNLWPALRDLMKRLVTPQPDIAALMRTLAQPTQAEPS